MASNTSVEQASKALKCQTWVLKVSIHCQGCKRKVKKVLQNIDGVYTTTIDSQQRKVTVTGNVSAEILINRLIKTGKRAEIWPEKLTGKENEARKVKVMDLHGQMDSKTGQDNTTPRSEKSTQFSRVGQKEESKDGLRSPEKSSNGGKSLAVNNKGADTEGGGAKKKKKGQKSNDGNSGSSSPNLGRTRAAAGTGCQSIGLGHDNIGPRSHHSAQNLQGLYTHPVYPVSYSMIHASKSPAPYRLTSPPYIYGSTHQVQPLPLDLFEILSDENVNGCFIM